MDTYDSNYVIQNVVSALTDKTSLFRKKLQLFQDNTFKPDTEFDFNQSRIWEKRDSEKLIKDNKAGIRFLPEHEANLRHQLEKQAEEENHSSNSKTCLSHIQTEELHNRDFDIELLSQVPIRSGYEALPKRPKCVKPSVVEEEKTRAHPPPCESAVVLVSSQKNLLEE